ncbi:MAG: hypothetical protein ACLFNK_04630 [Candidatus Woesearchaeota archaeon]
MGSRYFTVRLKKRPGKVRSSKPGKRTFDSEEKAKEWAKDKGITNYHLENLKSPESSEKKIRIVED